MTSFAVDPLPEDESGSGTVGPRMEMGKEEEEREGPGEGVCSRGGGPRADAACGSRDKPFFEPKGLPHFQQKVHVDAFSASSVAPQERQTIGGFCRVIRVSTV